MKRKIYGVLAVAILVANLVFPVSLAYAATKMTKISELCSKWKGSVEVRGSAGAICNGVQPQYSSECSSYGGTYDGSRCTWTNVDYTAGGGTGGTGGNTGGDTVDTGDDHGGTPVENDPGAGEPTTKRCGDVATSLISCGDSKDGSAIFDILAIALNVVTYGVGSAAVLGVVITGYQYMSARDNSAQVVKAKNRLLQVVIGLVIWVLFWGVLQFLLPGGLFANGS